MVPFSALYSDPRQQVAVMLYALSSLRSKTLLKSPFSLLDAVTTVLTAESLNNVLVRVSDHHS